MRALAPERVARRSGVRAILAAVVAVSCTLAFAASAMAAPQWGVAVKAENPYGLQGGDDPFTENEYAFQEDSGYNAYKITVTNTAPEHAGAVASGASVELTDELPEGLALAGPLNGSSNGAAAGEGWSCKITGKINSLRPGGEERPRVVKCKRQAAALAEGAHYPVLTLLVWVEADLESHLLNSATVSGGEAMPASATGSVETVIAPPVPFGLYRFNVADTKVEGARKAPNYELEGGTPSTQAGGHPVSFTTELEFNATTQFKGELTAPGGANYEVSVGPKEAEVELPPGFIGDPQNASFCTVSELERERCPSAAAVGYIAFLYELGGISEGKLDLSANERALVENMYPPPGHPAEFGLHTKTGFTSLFSAKVRTAGGSGRNEGDFGITAGLEAAPPLRLANVVFCSYGVTAEENGGTLEPSCKDSSPGAKAFLTNPTQCTKLAAVTLRTSPWSEPADVKTYFRSLGQEQVGVKGEKLGSEEFLKPEEPGENLDKPYGGYFTGCGALGYDKDTTPPSLSFTPPEEAVEGGGKKAAEPKPDEPTAMDLVLNIPQSGSEATVGSETVALGTPDLRNLKLVLPQGLSLNPSSAQGLGVCTDEEFALHSNTPASAACLAAQIGTVEVYTPLLPPVEGSPEKTGQLKGQLFIGKPECSECKAAEAQEGKVFRLFLQVQDPQKGLIVKLAGRAYVQKNTNQLETRFEEQPQLPFERVTVALKSGPRAPLATPQTCGAVETTSSLTPWSAPAEEAFETEPSTIKVACSGGGFNPTLEAGTTYPAAAKFSNFEVTIARKDSEGDLSKIEVHTPPGLTAKIANVPLCEEPQASAGECSSASQIGTVTAVAGSGPHPLVVEGGKVYLTGPYNGSEAAGGGSCVRYTSGCAPYGLAFKVPAVAGPFNLGIAKTASGTVPRAKIEVDESTAAVTVKANPLPQTVDGVEIRVRKINVDINRPEFFLNPTSCVKSAISANMLSAPAPAPSPEQGASPSAAFNLGGCRALGFAPKLTAYTKSNTSKSSGGSLFVKVSQKGGEANIHKVEVQLPLALPSRLTTLQHACTAQQFAKNRWGCPKESFVGGGTAHTPLLSVPLTGPAVLVSHAGAAFPDVDFLLHADGIEIVLVGHTTIKNGITYSKFESVPDQPIESFEARLPEGAHSVLAANGYLCSEPLKMPTTIVGQNGAEVTQETTIAVHGCPSTRATKLSRDLTACRKKNGGRTLARLTCEASARRKDAPKAKKSSSAGPGPVNAASTGVGAGPTGVGGSTTVSPGASAKPSTASGCPNEAVREEKTDGTAFSKQLPGFPECRAYELVSPVEKDGRGTTTLVAASPEGGSVGFEAEGVFGEPDNFFLEGVVAINPYVSHRVISDGKAEWRTTETLAPPSLVSNPSLLALLGSDFSPDLTSDQVECGQPAAGQYVCATYKDGKWASTPVYWPPGGYDGSGGTKEADIAQSEELDRFFIMPGVPLLSTDRLNHGGIYEISGLESGSPHLRLVNIVENEKHESEELELADNSAGETPLLGGYRSGAAGGVHGTGYHAVSKTGDTVFLTAKPQSAPAGVQEIYASVNQAPATEISSAEECVESEPEARCTEAKTKSAVFQGASADGEQVFFTTDAQLLRADRDATTDLYEYDFALPEGERLKLLSAGDGEEGTTKGDGADVQGVVRTSSDGSHVYFVAKGVLTLAQDKLGDKAQAGQYNLYAVELRAGGQVKFVATLAAADSALWGGESPECVPTVESCERPGLRRAQLNAPNGNYLVFDTYAHLAAEDENGCPAHASTCTAGAVYRYDAASEQLTWISRPAAGVLAPNEGATAEVKSALGSRTTDSAAADFEDMSRSISEDGRDVIFETEERLSPYDRPGSGEQVYLWRCGSALSECASPESEGEVSLISSGRTGTLGAVMSGSGGDIFFETVTPLAPQDTDELKDVYDARICTAGLAAGECGGIEPAAAEASCHEEACQGPLSALVEFGQPGSESFTAGLNFSPPPATATAALRTRSKSARASARPRAQAARRRAKTRSRPRASGRREGPDATGQVDSRPALR